MAFKFALPDNAIRLIMAEGHCDATVAVAAVPAVEATAADDVCSVLSMLSDVGTAELLTTEQCESLLGFELPFVQEQPVLSATVRVEAQVSTCKHDVICIMPSLNA
jgi:hypothetical protein